MAPPKSRKNLVWLDMEMSGLDPEKDRILEIATLITDLNLNILAQGPNLVIHQDPVVLKGMDSWNRRHHKNTENNESGVLVPWAFGDQFFFKE